MKIKVFTEKTFNFACYAHIWFEKGDDKAKRAILACLGSNLTLKGKKVFVNYHSFIKTLIKSRHAVEEELEKVRTSKVSSNKRQNPTNCEVSSLGLPHLNEFRTVKWQDLFDFPETSLNQMRQLLDQPEWVA